MHLVVCRDPKGLLTRCAHAADLHPSQKHTIVIMGGFGAPGMDEDFQTLNDVLLLHTDRYAWPCFQRLDTERVPLQLHSLSALGFIHCMRIGYQCCTPSPAVGVDKPNWLRVSCAAAAQLSGWLFWMVPCQLLVLITA